VSQSVRCLRSIGDDALDGAVDMVDGRLTSESTHGRDGVFYYGSLSLVDEGGNVLVEEVVHALLERE